MRPEWDKVAEEIVAKLQKIPEDKREGNLNYLITKMLKRAYKPSYFNYNRVIGLLECIKQEFYRRDVASYENQKIKIDGDVK